MAENEPQSLLTVKEVARELRMSPFTIYRKVERGDLAAVRVGENGPLRIRRQTVDEFLRPVDRRLSRSLGDASVGQKPIGARGT